MQKSKLLEYKNMYIILLPKETHVICMGSDNKWDDSYYYNYDNSFWNYDEYDYYTNNNNYDDYNEYECNYNFCRYGFEDDYSPDISNLNI